MDFLIEMIAEAFELVIDYMEYKFLASKYEDWEQESKRRRAERKQRRAERKRAKREKLST